MIRVERMALMNVDVCWDIVIDLSWYSEIHERWDSIIYSSQDKVVDQSCKKNLKNIRRLLISTPPQSRKLKMQLVRKVKPWPS